MNDYTMEAHWRFYSDPRNGNPTDEFNAKLWDWYRSGGREFMQRHWVK